MIDHNFFKFHFVYCRAINVEMHGKGGGTLSVKGCNFTENTGRGPGGAIHLYQITQKQTTVVIEDSQFYKNKVHFLFSYPGS